MVKVLVQDQVLVQRQERTDAPAQRQLGRERENPLRSTFYSMQVLKGLGEAHPHRKGNLLRWAHQFRNTLTHRPRIMVNQTPGPSVLPASWYTNKPSQLKWQWWLWRHTPHSMLSLEGEAPCAGHCPVWPLPGMHLTTEQGICYPPLHGESLGGGLAQFKESLKH